VFGGGAGVVEEGVGGVRGRGKKETDWGRQDRRQSNKGRMNVNGEEREKEEQEGRVQTQDICVCK